MNWVEWILQAGLVLGLATALPVALKLERALTALRKDRAQLAATVQGFTDATREAEAAIARLRAAAEGAGRQVAEQVTTAQALREDLRYLTDRAEALADRLDAGVRASRPADGAPARTATSAAASPPRPRAEQDLLRALGNSISQGLGRGS
jgi:septal ring factor EnvC (AmiA/AmiB activator)